jgi:4-hydroxybenzoate polyprenyltransferase
MKRYTYWPQLFLGITFNYGLILDGLQLKMKLDIIPIYFILEPYFGHLDTTQYMDIKILKMMK